MSAYQDMPPLDFSRAPTMQLQASAAQQEVPPAVRRQPTSQRDAPPTARRQPSVKREQPTPQVFMNLADSSEGETEVDSDGSVQDITAGMQVKEEQRTPKERQRSREKQSKRQPINAGNSSQDDTDDYDSDGNPGEAAKKKKKLFKKMAMKVEQENAAVKRETVKREAVKREVKSEYPAAAAASSSSAASSGGLGRDRLTRALNEAGAAAAAHSASEQQKADLMAKWAERDAIIRQKRVQDANDHDAAEAVAKKARASREDKAEEEDSLEEQMSYFGSGLDLKPLYTGAAAFTTGVAHSGSALARRTTERVRRAFNETGAAFHTYSSVADFSNLTTAAAIAAAFGAASSVTELALGTVVSKQAASALVKPLNLIGTAAATAMTARATMKMMDQAAVAAATAEYEAAYLSHEPPFMSNQGQPLGGSSSSQDTREQRAAMLEKKVGKK